MGAIAELAVGIVADRPERAIGFHEGAMNAASRDRLDTGGDLNGGWTTDCGAVAELTVIVRTGGPE